MQLAVIGPLAPADPAISNVQVALNAQLASAWRPTAWESELALGTGRTHQVPCTQPSCRTAPAGAGLRRAAAQIRAQFAAVGCPLYGEEMYVPAQPRDGAGQPTGSMDDCSQDPPDFAAQVRCSAAARHPRARRAWSIMAGPVATATALSQSPGAGRAGGRPVCQAQAEGAPDHRAAGLLPPPGPWSLPGATSL